MYLTGSEKHDARLGCMLALEGIVGRWWTPDVTSVLEDYCGVDDALERYPFQSKAFSVVGAGHFSLVLETDMLPGEVLKVSLRPGDAWSSYAAWCRQNKGLYGVPDILAVHRTDDLFMACMPKYLSIYETGCAEEALGVTTRALGKYCPTTTGNLAPRHVQSLTLVGGMISTYFQGIAIMDMRSDNLMWCPVRAQYIYTDPVSFTRSEEEY